MPTWLRPVFLVNAIIATLLAGCAPPAESTDAPRSQTSAAATTIYVVNYPLQYFAERIAGDQLRVEFPAPPTVDPAAWMPSAETIAEYQQAGLILLHGGTYAKWTATTSLPQSRVITTLPPSADHFPHIDGAIKHAHGPRGALTRARTATITWLDPTLAVAQANAIRAALVEKFPAKEAAFEEGFASLRADLMSLDEHFAGLVAEKQERPIYVSRPVFHHWIRRHQLNGKSLDWAHDTPLSAAEFQEFAALHAAHQGKWMIWDGAPHPDTVDQLQSLGIDSVVFQICNNVPAAGDYLAVMRENAKALSRVFADEPRR